LGSIEASINNIEYRISFKVKYRSVCLFSLDKVTEVKKVTQVMQFEFDQARKKHFNSRKLALEAL
jgi:hypothetical protein